MFKKAHNNIILPGTVYPKQVNPKGTIAGVVAVAQLHSLEVEEHTKPATQLVMVQSNSTVK